MGNRRRNHRTIGWSKKLVCHLFSFVIEWVKISIIIKIIRRKGMQDGG